MSRIRDILSGKVKWIRRTGWCDEPFVCISLKPVSDPTEAQIRYVKSVSTYSNQNFLQIRQLLEEGDRITFGLWLPEDVKKLAGLLGELGLTYSISKQKIYRPR